MRIAFWNIKNNENIVKCVDKLIKCFDLDIVLLAECDDVDKIIDASVRKYGMSQLLTIGCKDIRGWSRLSKISPGIQGNRYSMHIVNEKIILCCVHYMSDLNRDNSNERLELSRRIICDIEDEKELSGTKSVIIVGDMNAMPYEDSVLAANGLHGLPFVKVNGKTNRRVCGVDYTKYYNPMWNMFGDFSSPPGTYYYNNSSLSTPMWFMFDQVIISQNLSSKFNKKAFKIITEIEDVSLSDINGRPDKSISDHYPIFFEIR